MRTELNNTARAPNSLICLLLAVALVAAFTLARAVLTPVLGSQSPYMLYVAAVMIAGFSRGGLCGFLVLLAGGLTGLFLFSNWNHSLVTAARPLASLACFWAVSALALMMANELRRHSNVTFARLRRQVETTSARSGEGSVTHRAA